MSLEDVTCHNQQVTWHLGPGSPLEPLKRKEDSVPRVLNDKYTLFTPWLYVGQEKCAFRKEIV